MNPVTAHVMITVPIPKIMFRCDRDAILTTVAAVDTFARPRLAMYRSSVAYSPCIIDEVSCTFLEIVRALFLLTLRIDSICCSLRASPCCPRPFPACTREDINCETAII